MTAQIVFNVMVGSKTSKAFIFSKCRGDDFNQNISIDVQQVQAKAFDELMLNAYILGETDIKKPWVICVHGYNGVPKTVFEYADHFRNLKFNVLVPELRGHGKSKGKYIGLSYLDRYDINSWIEWILKEHPNAEIILFGVSMGGASIAMCCEYNNIDNVKAVVTDSTPSDMYRQLKKVYKYTIKLPFFPVFSIVEVMVRLRAGFRLEDASVLKHIENQKKPWLIIHGEKDGFVDVDMAKEMYQKAVCPKELVIFENADHTQALSMASKLYWKKVDKFISYYLDAEI